MTRGSSPTLRTVAKAAQVSHVTVSLALRDDPRLPVETRVRIKKLASEMGYQRKALLSMAMAQMRLRFPQRLAANLAFVNAVSSAITREFPFVPRLAGAEERARELGFGVEMIQAEVSQPRRTLIKQLQARGVHGIIILGSVELPWHSNLNALLDYFPAVYLGGARADWPLLHRSCTDPFAIGYGLARHVSQGKFSSVAFCLEEIQGAEEFADGYHAGCHSVGAKAPHLNRRPLKSDVVHSEAALRWFRQNRPDAIVTTCKSAEFWLKEAGVRIPEDVSLFHWNPPEGWSGWDNRNRELGAAAVDLAVGQIHRGERGIPASAVKVTLNGSFVQGKTSRQTSSQPVNWQSGYRSALRARGSSWHSLDLSAKFNSDYVRDWAFPLLHFSSGSKTIHGVPFEVGQAGRMDVHPCLHLNQNRTSPAGGGWDVSIPVGRKVAAVYFLHCATLRDQKWPEGTPGAVYPEYQFRCGSGAEERRLLAVPTKDGRGDASPVLDDWWPHANNPPRDFLPYARYLEVISDNDLETYKRRLYTYAWENPKPRDTLAAIRILMTARSAFSLTLFGITVQLA